ncbi:helix-turn-helix domain-containing protein [Zunongwangia sp. HRR-M8]|uniref:helix-turn-helix domain-containing protein n=1 Tax=Zunongwangia sp. HRR-M8 TaxID=3015170 RepID=UPI0022DD3FBE|nr:helix-turn-helix transcriptional regulator [Zunongwangia sp. HRR-M8]WBL20918.1 helix-turn-helix transcriptional regulator [Zunongwangia sp. HRR-M8]
MSYFGKNIRKIRNVKKLSQQAFAELFDLKRGTLGAYEEERSEPRIETIIRIANYFSISIDDLLTSELTVNKLLKFKDDLAFHGTFHKEKFTKVPCVTAKSEADYQQYYDKPHFIEDLPKLHLPINSEKKLRGYIISNLEMTNNDKGYCPKDVVIGEKIEQESYTKIANGNLVLIMVHDKLLLRKFYHSDEHITLRATNKNIDDIKIQLKDIKEMWCVKYCFLKRIPENNNVEIEQKLSFLEQEFMKLKENFK